MSNYTRLLFLMTRHEYEKLLSICRDMGFSTIDECITWAIERLIRRCHTGSMSSAISSDVSNHPPDG